MSQHKEEGSHQVEFVTRAYQAAPMCLDMYQTTPCWFDTSEYHPQWLTTVAYVPVPRGATMLWVTTLCLAAMS